MVDNQALVETSGVRRIQPRQEAAQQESSFGVTDLLEQSDKPFDHEAFHKSLKSVRDKVIDTGGIVFIPLLWGMPDPEEYFEEGNQLRIYYDSDHLTTYPEFTLRRPVSHVVRIGPFVARDYTSEPDPMTENDVNERVEAIHNFAPLVFPNHTNRFN